MPASKQFTWHYSDKVVTTFPSYSYAARKLGVSESVIRYYEANNIHSEADKKFKRSKA